MAYLPLVYVIVLSSIYPLQASSEDGKISVLVNKRGNGKLDMTCHIDESLRRLIQHREKFRLDSSIDPSFQNVKTEGFVRDKNGNQSFICSSEKEKSMTEDIHALKCLMIEEMKDLRASLELNKGQIKELNSSSAARKEEIKNLRASLQLKEGQIQELNSSLEMKEGQIKELNSSLLVKEEEIKSIKLTIFSVAKEMKESCLWQNLCPNEDEAINIITRERWGYEGKYVHQMRSRTAKYVIVYGNYFQMRGNNNTAAMHSRGSDEITYWGKLRCNFYIFEDGSVYEGIGMDHFNYVFNGGLGPDAIIIGFVKNDYYKSPSQAALISYHKLIKGAICGNKLSSEHSVIPHYLIEDLRKVKIEHFERKELSKWVNYESNLNFLFTIVDRNRNAIISREQWNGTKNWSYYLDVSTPIQYLLVQDHYARCFFNCKEYLQVIDGSASFYLAENGNVYEALGWEKTSAGEYQQKRVAYALFLGHFNSFGPNENIWRAFDYLVKEGIESGKLSKTFKIVNPHYLHSYLEEEFKKHDRYGKIFSNSF